MSFCLWNLKKKEKGLFYSNEESHLAGGSFPDDNGTKPHSKYELIEVPLTISEAVSMKITKKHLFAHEKVLTRSIQIFLCVLVVSRIAMSWKNYRIDVRYFVETARLILQGISPYHPETNPTPYLAPLQSPSMSLLSMPLCFTSELFQNVFFFFGSCFAFMAMTFMIFNYYGYSPKEISEARWRNVPIWITFSLIFISSPFLTVLVHGQNSCFAAFLLFVVLLYPKRDNGANIIYLGLAAAIKYSLLTMQVPVLIFQKRWRLSFFSVALFVVMVLSVGFWLDGIIPALKDYIDLVRSNVQSGNNSYGVSDYNFVHIGFFRYHFLNVATKFLLFLLYLLILYKIWRRGQKESDEKTGFKAFPERLTALDWAFFTILTMVISYHRVYDCILFLPFIGVLFIDLAERMFVQHKFKGANLFCVIILSFLLLFWAVPSSIVFRFESFLGKMFPAGENLFLYSSYALMHYDKTMFPLTKLILLCTAIFLFVIEMSPFSDRQINSNLETVCKMHAKSTQKEKNEVK